MAESNRRGEDAAAEHVDDVFDDAVDDDAETDAAGDKDKGGTALKTKTKSDPEKVGFFGRIGRFFPEVISELRKVIWPTRNELLTYTAVVVVFVTAITAIVMGLDYALAKGVLFVFGNPK